MHLKKTFHFVGLKEAIIYIYILCGKRHAKTNGDKSVERSRGCISVCRNTDINSPVLI